jgi:hypothetical protein
MFQKYSHTKTCCPERPKVPTAPYCPPSKPVDFDERNRAAIPESIRIRSQLCTLYVQPGKSSATCIPGGEEGGNSGSSVSSTAIPPGTDAPVEVRTRSAGEYIQLLGAQVLNASSNISNPDARFQQYFPESIPAPLSVVCPERIPNPVTVRDRGCVPQALFAPSVPGGPIQ